MACDRMSESKPPASSNCLRSPGGKLRSSFDGRRSAQLQLPRYASSHLRGVRMSNRMKLAFGCHLLAVLVLAAFAVTYLFRSEFMPYHAVAVGMPTARRSHPLPGAHPGSDESCRGGMPRGSRLNTDSAICAIQARRCMGAVGYPGWGIGALCRSTLRNASRLAKYTGHATMVCPCGWCAALGSRDAPFTKAAKGSLRQPKDH